jgi:hypothetical protein
MISDWGLGISKNLADKRMALFDENRRQSFKPDIIYH